MTVLFGLAASCIWAAVCLQPGTLLPPLSWPLLGWCTWLAVLRLRLRLNASDKKQAAVGLLSSVGLLLFLVQDTEFAGWGDVYYFCGSRMQYCTCSYRWNLAGWGKAAVLWAFVLSTVFGMQRLLVELVLQGLLPGEEVVTRESFISICWRLIPYWLNAWEQQWGAECSSMTFELPQFAVELLIILPCVQILCSRMKVLAMPSVQAALPRGWDAASPAQIQEAFVPNVQRGCWERRPEQKHFWQRVRANRHVTAFAALLCLLAATNSLYVPLHLENTVLAHPRTASMQAVGRLPELWGSGADLARISRQLQQGTMNLTHSFVTQEALKQAQHSRRPGRWRPGRLPAINLAQHHAATAAPPGLDVAGGVLPAGALGSSSFAAWVAAVELGPWRQNATWAAQAVEGLRQRLAAYTAECPEAATHLFQHNAWKHHYDSFKMADPNHRLSVPLIEAALALMRLSTEKFFVLLSLYVAFLLFRTPPPGVARLIGANARISNAFARMVLYSFPAVCWGYGAGCVFSTLVSVVFWGGPLWQVYHGLRTHACTVSVKGLRPATAAEIERMHNDCAICWCPMTVPGAAARPPANSTPAEPADAGSPPAETHAGGGSRGADDRAPLLAASDSTAAAVEPPAAGGSAAVVPGDVGDAAGSTLPCGHCYHQVCLTQWLQQCHGQGTAPTCPMCQARCPMTVKWHVCKALLAPEVWQLPARRRGRLAEEGDGGAEGAEQPPAPAAHNNYLLLHNPRLAELLADMPAFLAPENVQLLADVQELRWQRQQLARELQLRHAQLQRLEGRHHEMELRLEQQRQQLLHELLLLQQQLLEQQQGQQQQQQQGQHEQGGQQRDPAAGRRAQQGAARRMVPQQQQQALRHNQGHLHQQQQPQPEQPDHLGAFACPAGQQNAQPPAAAAGGQDTGNSSSDNSGSGAGSGSGGVGTSSSMLREAAGS